MTYKEKKAEYMRAWRQKNRERLNEYQRAYRAKNKEKAKEWQRAYWKRKLSEQENESAE